MEPPGLLIDVNEIWNKSGRHCRQGRRDEGPGGHDAQRTPGRPDRREGQRQAQGGVADCRHAVVRQPQPRRVTRLEFAVERPEIRIVLDPVDAIEIWLQKGSAGQLWTMTRRAAADSLIGSGEGVNNGALL